MTGWACAGVPGLEIELGRWVAGDAVGVVVTDVGVVVVVFVVQPELA